MHSLLPKIDEVHHANSLNIHCLSVNEKFSDSSMFDHEISIHNYSLFRKNRNRHGGGVALYVQNTFNSVPLDLESHTKYSLLLKSKAENLLLVLFTDRPTLQLHIMIILFMIWKKIYLLSTEIILMGDFN